MITRKTTAIEISPDIHEQVKAEVKNLNDLAKFEYDKLQESETERAKRKLKEPVSLTLRSYSEAALEFYLKNHVDPRNVGDEKDVISEIRKLRNNVFSFMRVQEQTHLIPFTSDVKKLHESNADAEKSMSEVIKNTSEIATLLEVIFDVLLIAQGINDEERNRLIAYAMKRFASLRQS